MRKKGVFAGCLLALMLILAGCAAVVPGTESDETEESAEALEELLDGLDGDWAAKSHRWQILDDQGNELYTVSDEEAAAEIDGLFQGDDWKSLSLGGESEAETALYTYVFWQEKTLLAGQDPKEEREYEEVIRFMIPAEGNTVTMLVLQGLENWKVPESIDLEELLTFRSTVPEETMEALRDPWRFA